LRLSTVEHFLAKISTCDQAPWSYTLGEQKREFTGACTYIEHRLTLVDAGLGNSLPAPEVVEPEAEATAQQVDVGRDGREDMFYVEVSLF
jgi:hypothetical protein